MAVRRDLSNEPEDNDLKAASKRLIRAAGGTAEAAEAIATDDYPVRQQHLSDCTLPNSDRFLTLRELRLLMGRAHGQKGWLDPLLVIARQAGQMLVPRPAVGEQSAWGRSLQDLGREFGEVSGAVCSALGDPATPGEITAQEVREYEIIQNLDELAELVARMRAMAVQVVDREGRE